MDTIPLPLLSFLDPSPHLSATPFPLPFPSLCRLSLCSSHLFLPSALYPSPLLLPLPSALCPSVLCPSPPLIPLPLPSPPLLCTQGRTKLLQLLFSGNSSVLFGTRPVQFDRKESFLVCDDGLLQLEGAWSQVPSHSDLSGVDKSE